MVVGGSQGGWLGGLRNWVGGCCPLLVGVVVAFAGGSVGDWDWGSAMEGGWVIAWEAVVGASAHWVGGSRLVWGWGWLSPVGGLTGGSSGEN